MLEAWYPGEDYSTFRNSGLELKRSDGGIQISARVTNDSLRDGDEVVQLYVGRELKGFERVHIESGRNRTVEFMVGADQTEMRRVSRSA